MYYNPIADVMKPDIETYKRLSSATIRLSDNIATKIALKINDELLAEKWLRSGGDFHLQQDEGSMNIYLPKDPKACALCKCQKFPNQLAANMGVKDPKGQRVIGHVLREDPILLDDLLAQEGVISLDNVTRIEPARLDRQSSTAPTVPSRPQTPVSSGHSRVGTPSSGAQSSSGASSRQFGSSFSPAPSAFSTLLTPFSTPSYQPSQRSRSVPFGNSYWTPPEVPHSQPSQEPYRRLIDKVIQAAEQTRCVDQHEYWTVDNASQLFGNDDMIGDDVFGIRSQNQVAHDIKVGAVGELFVSPKNPKVCAIWIDSRQNRSSSCSTDVYPPMTSRPSNGRAQLDIKFPCTRNTMIFSHGRAQRPLTLFTTIQTVVSQTICATRPAYPDKHSKTRTLLVQSIISKSRRRRQSAMLLSI